MDRMAQQMSRIREGNDAAADEFGCEVCGDVITQPVCTECLESEMNDWLANKGKQTELLTKYIEETTKTFKAYDYIDTKCAICGKNMRACAHCFCSEIFDYIKAFAPGLEEEFITHFDFNIHFRVRQLEPISRRLEGKS